MNPALDSYYSREEVSNSDLSWLKNQLFPREMHDPTEAFKFGNLIDAMLTEPHRVNYFKRTCDEDQFTPEEFETAEKMKNAALRDTELRYFLENSESQKVMIAHRKFICDYNAFELDCRCKWDFWLNNSLNWGGDIKSTSATTQSQFEAAAKYFDYDRQRAWYMDIAGSDKDIIVAISKVNFKIFKIFIKRDSDFYREGFSKYNMLALRWHMIFGNHGNK